MARPKPTVFEEHPSGKYIEQVIDCEGVFAVLYKNKPFQLRHLVVMGNITKYTKSVFVNSAHAHRLADRLNKQLKTTDFTVKQLI